MSSSVPPDSVSADKAMVAVRHSPPAPDTGETDLLEVLAHHRTGDRAIFVAEPAISRWRYMNSGTDPADDLSLVRHDSSLLKSETALEGHEACE